MRCLPVLAIFAAFLVPAAPIEAQPIIAQLSGLPSPQHVITFGAGLYPNFSSVTTQFAGITVAHASYFTTGTVNNLVGGFLTNDFSGLPNTLRITFASPIHDLSFVYHQISTAMPSAFRAVLAGTTVDSFSNLSNQTQPNNYFGFTNVWFDELQLDFVSDFNVDTLAFNDGAACTFRNGTGVNPPDFTCTTRPVLGTNWQSSIATNPGTIATFLALAPGGPQPGTPFLGGELLVQLNPSPIAVAGFGTFSIAIPTGSMWLGFQLATQGVRLDTVGGSPAFVLLNALDLVLGL